MRYSSVKNAIFLSRPNRFIANVLVDGQEEVVHVKNTGRCREILREGSTVILEPSSNPQRKTRYSLISCYKGDTLINIDSQVPNAVVHESILNGKLPEFQNIVELKREVKYGNSRFDLAFTSETTKGFIEVKGVTLEENGVAMFPDAPTQRGTKHIYEMINAVKQGFEGYIFFLIQLKGVKYFTPNDLTDLKFSEAISMAYKNGVNIVAYDSIVTQDEIIISDRVEVRLK